MTQNGLVGPPTPERGASDPHSVYRRDGDTTLIEIRLREVRQLFQTLDPAPFFEKDLAEDAAHYLVEACREVGRARPARVVFYLPGTAATTSEAETVPAVVHHYFAYRAHQLGVDLAELLRTGALSLAIGAIFLAGCLVVRRALLASPAAALYPLAVEGLLIIGWVAMWRPLEVFLYDWWPLLRHRAVLRRLSVMPIEMRPLP